MSQFAESTDGFEVDSNEAPVADTPVVSAAPVAASVAAAPVETDDIEIDGALAARDRNTDGTFKGREAAPVEAKPEAQKSEKPRDNPNARIEQAIARQREAERKAADLERRLHDIEARSVPRREEPAKPAQAEYERFLAMPDAPREEDFDNYTKFTAAMGLFVADKRIEERETKTRQSAAAMHQEQANAKRVDAYAARVDAAITADPQFLSGLSEEVVSLRPTIALRPGEKRTVYNAIADEIVDSEQSVALMRHLSDHPDELQRLATLPPRALTRQMAILESRLDAAPAGTATTTHAISQAKPPVRPVTGSPSVTVDDGSDDESVEAHIARENTRERQRRRA